MYFHGFLAQKLILIHTELSEAVEADRVDNFADLRAFDHETVSDCSDARFREGIYGGDYYALFSL